MAVVGLVLCVNLRPIIRFSNSELFVSDVLLFTAQALARFEQ